MSSSHGFPPYLSLEAEGKALRLEQCEIACILQSDCPAELVKLQLVRLDDKLHRRAS